MWPKTRSINITCCWLERQVLGPRLRSPASETLGVGFAVCAFANTPGDLVLHFENGSVFTSQSCFKNSMSLDSHHPMIVTRITLLFPLDGGHVHKANDPAS